VSWSDHHVVVEVGRASSCLLEWVFIMYPGVKSFGVLGVIGDLGDRCRSQRY